MTDIITASEQISLFNRLNLNSNKNLPVRSSEMGMLIYLVMTDGEKNPNSVAHFFKVSKGMATNMTTSLLKSAYIEKKQSKDDKRKFILQPTEKAKVLVQETYQEYFQTVSLLQEKLGAEKFANLIALLSNANDILLEERKNG